MKKHVPGLPDACVHSWPLLDHDVLALHMFLDAFADDDEVVAVDVGTFLGLSSFALAIHPQVARVISVDTNPRIADEIAKANVIGELVDNLEGLGETRVLDVARAILDEFPTAAEKIEIFEGQLGQSGPNGTIDLHSLLQSRAVALVDGLHTTEGVAADLSAIFSAGDDVIAVLDDCRYVWGPEVQGGVARFLREQNRSHAFRLLADVSTSFSRSNLGFVYRSTDERAAAALSRLDAASANLDPLSLLTRNEELSRVTAQQREELAQARALLALMQQSRSWKVTAPLRALDAGLRRAGGQP